MTFFTPFCTAYTEQAVFEAFSLMVLWLVIDVQVMFVSNDKYKRVLLKEISTFCLNNFQGKILTPRKNLLNHGQYILLNAFCSHH